MRFELERLTVPWGKPISTVFTTLKLQIMAGDMLLILGLLRLRPRSVQTQALAAYRAVATGNLYTAPLKEQVRYLHGWALPSNRLYLHVSQWIESNSTCPKHYNNVAL